MSSILTPDQIEEICDYIPQSYPQIKLYDSMIDNIKNNIRAQLRGKRIVNDPNALEELKEGILKSFVLAKVKNEEFKGIQAAHVLGNISSQTMLHAKRGGGQNQYVSTFDTIKNFVEFKDNMDDRFITATLAQSSATDAEMYRKYIPSLISTSLKDIVEDHEFIDYTTGNDGSDIPALRLYLNRYMMYERKISIGTVIEVLMRPNLSYINIPKRSTFEAYLDIYVDPTNVEFSEQTLLSDLRKKSSSLLSSRDEVVVFFTRVIIDNMKSILIAGSDDAEYVSLTKENINSFILREELIDEDLDAWMIHWDQVGARNKGILFENIQDIFNVLGVEPFMHDNVPYRFFIYGWPHVSSPLSLIRGIEIGEYIGQQVETPEGLIVTYEEDKVTIDELKDLFSGIAGDQIEVEFELDDRSNEPTNQIRLTGHDFDIVQYLKELYNELNGSLFVRGLEVYGNNVIKLLEMSDIDPRTVISNNPRVVLALYGIEALRYMMISTMSDLMFGSGKEFNVRHLQLIVDHITMHGYITPISKLGIVGHDLGPITELSYSEGDKVLGKAAQFGIRDEMNTISAFIMTGIKGRYGTDYARETEREIPGLDFEREILRKHEEDTVSKIYS